MKYAENKSYNIQQGPGLEGTLGYVSRDKGMILWGWPSQQVLAAQRLSFAFLHQSFPVSLDNSCCCISRTLQVCSHALVFILLAFGPIQLRCEGRSAQRAKPSCCGYTEMEEGCVKGRLIFPFLLLALHLESACVVPITPQWGSQAPHITFSLQFMAAYTPSWLYASHEGSWEAFSLSFIPF